MRIETQKILKLKLSLTLLTLLLQAEDFYVLNEDVAEAAALAAEAAADRQAGEPSNELASYTLPDAELLATGVLPPPGPALLTKTPAKSGKIGRRRGGKKNTR